MSVRLPPPRRPAFLPVLLACLLLALSATPTSATATPTMVSIDRPVVYLREGAGTDHAAVWKLSRGYPLQVQARRQGWLKVRDFEGDQGWVLGRLTARKPHLVVKVEVANLRSAPGTRARRIGQARYGEVLRTLAHRQGWVRVKKAGGTTGWVARRLLWGW